MNLLELQKMTSLSRTELMQVVGGRETIDEGGCIQCCNAWGCGACSCNHNVGCDYWGPGVSTKACKG